MKLRLDGRTALVCASTRGLGRASAAALSRLGASVIVTGREQDAADIAAAELSAAMGLAVDLTSPDGVGALIDRAVERSAPIDIVVLNGPGPPPGAAADLTPEQALIAAQSLLLTHITIVSRVLPGMRERGFGRIVGIGSSGVVAPLPNLAASNLGRAGLWAYLKTLAGEVAVDGVTVNMAIPGRIATDRVAALDRAIAERSGRDVEDVRAASESSIPARRYGTPEEFGAVVAFLCTQAASYVNGSGIRCDGGLLGSL